MNAVINFYTGQKWTTVNLLLTPYGVTAKNLVGTFKVNCDGKLNVGILRADNRPYYINNPFK